MAVCHLCQPPVAYFVRPFVRVLRTDSRPHSERDTRNSLLLRLPDPLLARSRTDDRPSFRRCWALHKQCVGLNAPLFSRGPSAFTTFYAKPHELFHRRGLEPDSDPEESDALCRDQPWLAGLYAAAVSGKTAYGPHASRRKPVARDRPHDAGPQFDPAGKCIVSQPA